MAKAKIKKPTKKEIEKIAKRWLGWPREKTRGVLKVYDDVMRGLSRESQKRKGSNKKKK